MTLSPKLTGLIAAPFTSMHADGSLRLETIEQQAELLVRSGVIGAFVCGTTGEGVALSCDERRKVAQRWKEVAGGELKIIVHVGHTCAGDAGELASHAAKIGAYAVAAMAPPFFRAAAVKDLVDFIAPIAQAAGQLPFYYYHIPSMTGVNLPMHRLLEEAAPRIPNLRGLKFTHNNLMEFQQCLTACDGQFDMLFGQDEILLAALAVGANGAVGSTYNYAAPLYLRMINAFRAGNLTEAQRYASRAVALVDVLMEFGPMAAGKAIMSLAGVDCGPVRPPLPNLIESRRAQLFERIRKLEVVDGA